MTKEGLNVLLEELVSLPKETEWVEFKLNYYDKEDIGKYISALSNSACLHDRDYGYLVFGVENESQLIKGTSIKLTKKKVGAEELENWLIRLLNPRIDFRIFEFFYNDLPVVIVEIDAARVAPVSFLHVRYIRIGSYKKKLADYPEKERKIWDKINRKAFEKEIALSNVDEDNVLSRLDYPAYFTLMNDNLPANKIAILEKLCEEKLIVKNRNKFNITNLGAILFAKDLSDFENLSRKAIRVIIYKGKNKLNTIKEYQETRGYAIGFESLINYINEQLPTNEEIGRVFRKEVKMYPEIAIRELVANAIIHQDFNETGTSPMVEIFDDRIEISNSGKPLISTLRFIDHNPQSRNEKLASFMRRINICEERGSGIDKVIYSTEVFQLPAPDFIESDNFFKVIMYSYKTLRQMDKKDKIRACYQHCCLRYVSNDYMYNQTLRERFGVEEKNYSMISRIISETIESTLIKDYDSENKAKRYAKYIPFWA